MVAGDGIEPPGSTYLDVNSPTEEEGAQELNSEVSEEPSEG